MSDKETGNEKPSGLSLEDSLRIAKERWPDKRTGDCPEVDPDDVEYLNRHFHKQDAGRLRIVQKGFTKLKVIK